MDDLLQTLIGPMFVVAKLLVKPGMRRDLASYLAGERSRVLKQPRWRLAVPSVLMWPVGTKPLERSDMRDHIVSRSRRVLAVRVAVPRGSMNAMQKNWR